MFGDKIKNLREEKELNQIELAEALNIDRGAYGNYEREYIIIPLKHLNNLANYFNVSIDYIFNFTDTLKYENSLNDINKIKVGERLKEFRKENKITIAKLAETINIGNGTVAGYESGRYLISTAVLYDICKRYYISADYLLGKIDNPKYLK